MTHHQLKKTNTCTLHIHLMTGANYLTEHCTSNWQHTKYHPDTESTGLTKQMKRKLKSAAESVCCLALLKISHLNVFLSSFDSQINILHREQPVKHVSHMMAQPKSMQLGHHSVPAFDTQSSGEWQWVCAYIINGGWIKERGFFFFYFFFIALVAMFVHKTYTLQIGNHVWILTGMKIVTSSVPSLHAHPGARKVKIHVTWNGRGQNV